MKKISVLISGGGTNLQAIIDGINSTPAKINNGQIVQVISSREDAFGLERAKKAGIKTKVFKSDEEILAALQEEETDLIVLAGYMKILGKDIISNYKDKILNIHPSLIPNYCGKGFYGMRVHNAVVAAGEEESGATVHFVDEGVDTGAIILQEKVKLEKTDDPETVAKKVLKIEHEILPKAIDKIINGGY